MSVKAFFEKAAGARFCCSCGCCDENGLRPFMGEDEGGFDLFLIIRLIISATVFAAALIFEQIPEPWPLVMLIASAVISGYDIAAATVLSVIKGRYFDKCVLILIAAAGAFALGMYTEGAALVLLFQLGASMIDYAYMRSRQTISATVDCTADTAHILTDGGEETVPAESIVPGNNIIINSGERVPCDCIVLEGGGSLDSSPLGGGTDPLFVAEGDEVLSGCILKSGCLRCEATAAKEDSSCAVFTKTIRTAADTGGPVPTALRRFLALYTPFTFVLAVIVAGLLPLIYKIGILYAIRRALVFLVVANPCAIFVALPLIRYGSLAGAAKRGILFSGIDVMDSAVSAASVVFERAGAMTDGIPHVSSIKTERMDADTFIKMTAHALAYSDSQIANSVISSYGGTIYIELIEDFKELPGKGVEVYVEGVRICAGNLSLMAEKSITVPEADITVDQAVYVSVAQEYAGRILLSESLREDAAVGVTDLAGQGIGSVILLTDEHPSSAAKTASELKIKEYYSDCGREQKLETVENIRQSLSANHSLLFVGGQDIAEMEHTKADLDISINDVQALNSSLSSDLTILNGKVSGVAAAIASAKHSERVSYMTIFAVLFIKLIVLVLAFLGIATIWFAAFIDAAAALGAILFAISVLTFEPSAGGKKLLRK